MKLSIFLRPHFEFSPPYRNCCVELPFILQSSIAGCPCVLNFHLFSKDVEVLQILHGKLSHRDVLESYECLPPHFSYLFVLANIYVDYFTVAAGEVEQGRAHLLRLYFLI